MAETEVEIDEELHPEAVDDTSHIISLTFKVYDPATAASRQVQFLGNNTATHNLTVYNQLSAPVISAMQQSLSSLTPAVQQAVGQIQTLQNNVTGIQSTLSGAVAKNASQDNLLAAAAQTNDIQQSEIIELQGDLQNVADLLIQVQQQVQNIESNGAGNVGQQIQAINAEIDVLQSQATTATNRLNNQRTDIDELESRLNNESFKIFQLDQRVDDHQELLDIITSGTGPIIIFSEGGVPANDPAIRVYPPPGSFIWGNAWVRDDNDERALPHGKVYKNAIYNQQYGNGMYRVWSPVIYDSGNQEGWRPPNVLLSGHVPFFQAWGTDTGWADIENVETALFFELPEAIKLVGYKLSSTYGWLDELGTFASWELYGSENQTWDANAQNWQLMHSVQLQPSELPWTQYQNRTYYNVLSNNLEPMRFFKLSFPNPPISSLINIARVSFIASLI